MFGDENDYKFQMEIDSAKHMEVTPEVIAVDASAAHSESSLYDSRHGFSDVDMLASLKGFTDEVPVAITQDSVSEFIVQSENVIQFNNMGEPVQHHAAEDQMESLPHNLEPITSETLAMFDQEDNR